MSQLSERNIVEMFNTTAEAKTAEKEKKKKKKKGKRKKCTLKKRKRMLPQKQFCRCVRCCVPVAFQHCLTLHTLQSILPRGYPSVHQSRKNK